MLRLPQLPQQLEKHPEIDKYNAFVLSMKETDVSFHLAGPSAQFHTMQRTRIRESAYNLARRAQTLESVRKAIYATPTRPTAHPITTGGTPIVFLRLPKPSIYTHRHNNSNDNNKCAH